VCEAHAQQLRGAFQPYIQHARNVAGARQRLRAGQGTAQRVRGAEVRAWARERGIMIRERGRISAQVIRLYTAAH
jgi:hypothetical protein